MNNKEKYNLVQSKIDTLREKMKPLHDEMSELINELTVLRSLVVEEEASSFATIEEKIAFCFDVSKSEGSSKVYNMAVEFLKEQFPETYVSGYIAQTGQRVLNITIDKDHSNIETLAASLDKAKLFLKPSTYKPRRHNQPERNVIFFGILEHTCSEYESTDVFFDVDEQQWYFSRTYSGQSKPVKDTVEFLKYMVEEGLWYSSSYYDEEEDYED